METLKTLPNITKLNDYVTRILGQNPGKFTLQGTNTYLVSRRPPFILIDTGEGREEYVQLLESVLRQSREQPSGTSRISSMLSDIIITHRHPDHYGGLRDVLKTICKLQEEYSPHSEFIRPRIHKFPLHSDVPDSTHENELQSILTSLPSESYQAAPSGSPLHDLRDFQRLQSSDESVSLEVFHTPGHTPDSICLFLRDPNNPEHEPSILFTADSVLGQGTTVFEDLTVYIQSLQRLLTLRDDASANAEFKTIYPGHGPVVDDGPELISTYIKHRLEREAQIVDVLSRASPDKVDTSGTSASAWTIWDIVGQIYKDYPESLWLPAAHGVGLHLKKLEKDGRARCVGGEGIEQRWFLSSKL